jgi:hypothetical protein
MGCSFAVFHTCKNWVRDRYPDRLGALLDFGIGGLAGFCSKTLVLPLDVVKRRMQIAGLAAEHTVFEKNAFPTPESQGGWISAARSIYRREGLLAFWKGFWPTILKSIPGTAVTFSVHSWLLRLFNK